MSEFIHITHGKEEQYEEIMDLLNDAFAFKGIGKFNDLLPKLYTREYKMMNNQVVLDVDGDLRAAIGVFYNNLHVGDETLKVAGIGNVGVPEKHRSKGYMQATMMTCLDEMKQNMTDISFLSGHRQRYAYFSYEPGGVKLSFVFLKRNFRHMYGKYEKSGDCVAFPLNRDDTEIIKKMKEFNDSRPCHFDRPVETFFDTTISWYDKPYYVEKNGEYIGYFIINDEYTYVHEIGYTDEKYIEDIVHCAIDICKDDEITVTVPEYETAICSFLYKHGESNSIDISEKFNILNYEKVIRAYLKLQSTYKSLADGHIIIQINGLKLPETIEITVKENVVDVYEAFDKPDIVLEHMEAMQIICSAYSDTRGKKLPGNVASWFPLPLFVSSTDCV